VKVSFFGSSPGFADIFPFSLFPQHLRTLQHLFFFSCFYFAGGHLCPFSEFISFLQSLSLLPTNTFFCLEDRLGLLFLPTNAPNPNPFFFSPPFFHRLVIGQAYVSSQVIWTLDSRRADPLLFVTGTLTLPRPLFFSFLYSFVQLFLVPSHISFCHRAPFEVNPS